MKKEESLRILNKCLDQISSIVKKKSYIEDETILGDSILSPEDFNSDFEILNNNE